MEIDELIKALRHGRPRRAGQLALKMLEALGHKVGGKRYGKRSLAAKISALQKRESSALTWWGNRPEVRRVLAQQLDLPEEQSDTVGVVSMVAAFAELPALGGLSLDREELCDLGFTAWNSMPREGESLWVVAPRGAGCTTTARLLHARLGVRVVAADSLTEAWVAVNERIRGPVVLDVDSVSSADDQASEQLRARGNVLVLAHSLPPDAMAEDAWGRFSSMPHRSQSRWRIVSWRPAPGWRRRLLAWIHARLARGKQNPRWTVEQIDEHLEHFDPTHRRVDTPGALLWLLATLRTEADAKALFSASGDALIETYVERAFLRSGSDRKARAVELVRHLRRVVMTALTDLAHPWDGTLPRAALEVQAVPKATRGERSVVSPSQRAADARHLRRLVREVRRDRCSLGPRWVLDLLAASALSERLREHRALTDVALAGATDRQRVVDAALDLVSSETLGALVLQATRAEPTPSYACVASLECLYSAVARRMEQHPLPIPREAAAALLRRVFDLWRNTAPRQPTGIHSETWVPVPLTRPGVRDRFGDGDAWVADCWAWSLCMTASSAEDDALPAWLFPGWARRLRRADLSETLSHELVGPLLTTYRPGDRDEDRPWDPTSFARLERWAVSVLARVRDWGTAPNEEAEELAPPLLEAALCSTDRAKILTDLRQLGSALARPAIGARLAASLEKQVGVREEIAGFLWSLAEQEEAQERAAARHGAQESGVVGVMRRLQKEGAGSLLELVARHLPAETWVRSFADHGPGSATRLPRGFASIVVTPWTEWALVHGRDEHVGEMLEAGLWPDDPTAQLALAQRATRWGPVSTLWQWRPALAFEAARSFVRRDHAAVWFGYAPPSAAGALLDLLDDEVLRAAPRWLDPWIRMIVRSSPALAERAFQWWTRVQSGGASVERGRG